MARTLARCLLAAVLVAAHLPLPLATGRTDGHDPPMACCAPKDCCDATHVCSSGGGCGGEGAPGGVGLQMFAGGCGHETPGVTPLQLDPTVAAQSVGLMHTLSALPAPSAFDPNFHSLSARPLVPPPRA